MLEQGKKEIIISWVGWEPLRKKDEIIRFNNHIRSMTINKDAAFFSNVITNGCLLNEDAVRSLYESGVTYYELRLDKTAHDQQRILANDACVFQAAEKNIHNMLKSELNFTLTIQVSITAVDLEFSFYDTFFPYKEDRRLLFKIIELGKCGVNDFYLLLQNNGKCANNTLKQHKEYLKSLGFTLIEEMKKGILSNGCYAASQDMFVIRADGKIGKCTYALDDENNNIGYLDIENNRMVIDYNAEDLWAYNPLDTACYVCKNLATCCNRSCPLEKQKNLGSNRCCINL